MGRVGRAQTPHTPLIVSALLSRCAVAAHLDTIALPENARKIITAHINAVLDDEQTDTTETRRALTKQLRFLQARAKACVRKLGNPQWQQDLLDDEINQITKNIDNVHRQLADLTSSVRNGHTVIATGLDLLTNPGSLYNHGDSTTRAAIIKALIARLTIDLDDDTVTVTSHTLNEPFDVLSTATPHRYTLTETITTPTPTTPDPDSLNGLHTIAWQPQRNRGGTLLLEDAAPAVDLFTLVNLTPEGRGSYKRIWVGDTGIEPVTPSV